MKAKYLSLLPLLFATPAIASSLEDIHNATYELYQNGYAICSGQFVDPTTFLTAGHCYSNPDSRYEIVIPAGNKTWKFELVDPVTVGDALTFKLADPEMRMPYTVDVSVGTEPKLGESVYVSSFPNVIGYNYIIEGTFVGRGLTPPNVVDSVWSYLVSVDVSPGSSGGGLYYEILPDEYVLIGTVQLRYGGTTMAWFSTIDSVLDVIERD